MIRKLLLVTLWFPSVLVLLTINLTVLSYMSHWEKPALPLSSVAPSESSYAASSQTAEVLSANVVAGDARTVLLENFFQKHNSPMTPYAQHIVNEADSYGLDFRLLPAIAMCESNLGKRVPLKAGFNPFGIAVYTGTQEGKNFDDWEHAISWVSAYVYNTYYANGRTELLDIETTWAPPSAAGGHEWSTCVEFFENSIL